MPHLLRSVVLTTVFAMASMFGPSTSGSDIDLMTANAPISRFYVAPGLYGTAYGSPSYGVPRTYSQFPSPFGGIAYGFGLKPYRRMESLSSYEPGAASNPATTTPGEGSYSIFYSPYDARYTGSGFVTVPFGVYGPGLGFTPYAPVFGSGVTERVR